MMTIHSLTRCTPAKPIGKLGMIHAGGADFVTMVDNGVTNLSGKSLSKLIR